MQGVLCPDACLVKAHDGGIVGPVAEVLDMPGRPGHQWKAEVWPGESVWILVLRVGPRAVGRRQ